MIRISEPARRAWSGNQTDDRCVGNALASARRLALVSGVILVRAEAVQ